jgi:hypothetical protein
MRKQSPETQLRHLKGKLKSQMFYKDALIAEIKLRRQWGQMMANICFNLAQNDNYEPTHRQSMRDCREGWDKIRSVPIS